MRDIRQLIESNTPVSKILTEKITLLQQSHLDSESYQKAKKMKGFDAKNYTWNSKTDLYDKVNESGDQMAYKAHYAATLKKFGAKDVGDLSDEDKKKFFKAVDDGYEAKNEAGNPSNAAIRRMEGLVGTKDKAAFMRLAKDMAEVFYDDGFEEEDVRGYLQDIIRQTI